RARARAVGRAGRSGRRCFVKRDGARRPQWLRPGGEGGMSFTFEEADEYAAQHSTPATDVLRRLGEETEKTQDVPQMSVGALEGAFLRFLIALKQPRLVLELGVFTGWSSIEMATALPPGGKIVACD